MSNPKITITKQSTLELVLDEQNLNLANTTFKVEDGTLRMVGLGAFGGATKMVLAGGTFRIEGIDLVPGAGPGDEIGRWTFDNVTGNTVHDEGTGDSADGTLTNGASIDPGGIVGEAVSLDSALQQHVDLGNPAKLDMYENNFSISAWIKGQDTADDSETIFAKGGNWDAAPTLPGIRYMLCTNEAAPDGICEFTTDQGGPSDPNKVEVAGTTYVYDGGWHHVVGLREGLETRLYVDGVEEGSLPLPDPYNLDTSMYKAYIGAVADVRDAALPPARFFQGLIDEVRFYDRALLDPEIAGLAGMVDLDRTT